jgi:oxygen-independent coproporphyrinogen-3 oxidase
MTDNILDRDSMMTTSYIDNIYYERISNPLLNTSYPLDSSEWSKYAQLGSLKFSGESIAFYLHIPFCRHLCKFCEYTRMPIPDAAIQMMYIDTLGRDIYRYLEAYPHTTLYGLDIGGGTPFALCDDAFDALASLINDILQSTTQCRDFEPSIEGTFQTLSQYKIEAITKVGVKRLSLGLQSSSKSLMQSYNRESEHLKAMVEAIRSIHIWGIEKINIDVMYGLPGQTKGSIEKDLQVLKELSPEQVTVYEFRCNQVNRNYMITPEERFKQYHLLYEGLT